MFVSIASFALLATIFIAFAISVPNLFFAISGRKDLFKNRALEFTFFGITALVICMILVLEYAFVKTDLSFQIVYLNSHQAQPFIYRIAGVWANHEGSMLLWLFVLCASGCIYAIISKSNTEFKALVLSTQSLSIMIFGLYLYLTSNPFTKNLIVPQEGLGLNPILQDYGLLLHPPSLYLGYVGFSISYSIIIALLVLPYHKKMALHRYKYFKTALKEAKIWALLSWSILTFGILMGSLWSYRELGWGGYWFWDPVENASLIPWLLSIALIHSIFVYEKRKIMFGWIVAGSITTYTSSILGTFIVRSGLLNSVHTFASAPERGLFLILTSLFFVCLALVLYFSARKSKNNSASQNLQKLGKNKAFGKIPEQKFVSNKNINTILSKELCFLINNSLMFFGAFVILFATLYPILAEKMFHVKLSIGPKYYNIVIFPIASLTLIFSFLGSNIKWNGDTFSRLRFALRHELMFLLLSFYLYFLLPIKLTFVISIVGIFLINFYKKCKNRKNSFNSMLSEITHFSFALLIFAIIANSEFEKEISYKLKVGESIEFDGQLTKLEDLRFFQKDNFLVRQGVILFGKNYAYPENRIYIVERSNTQESYRINNLLDDYYFSISSTDGMEPDEIIMNITLKSYINLIWIAGSLIVISGLGKLLIYFLKYRKAF